MRLFVLCSSQVNVGLGRRGELGLCHILVTPSRLRVWLPQASISPLRLVSPPKNFPLRTDAPLVSPPSSFGRLLHNFRDMVLISNLHLHLVSVFFVLFCLEHLCGAEIRKGKSDQNGNRKSDPAKQDAKSTTYYVVEIWLKVSVISLLLCAIST